VCCDFGYDAAPGFDAVSGLGTPYFPRLLGAPPVPLRAVFLFILRRLLSLTFPFPEAVLAA
jgi:hypothetical protein